MSKINSNHTSQTHHSSSRSRRRITVPLTNIEYGAYCSFTLHMQKRMRNEHSEKINVSAAVCIPCQKTQMIQFSDSSISDLLIILSKIREAAKQIEYKWSNLLSETERKKWESISYAHKSRSTEKKISSKDKVNPSLEKNTAPSQKRKAECETPKTSPTKTKKPKTAPKNIYSSDAYEFLKPKRPTTAYLFFAQEMRPKIKTLHPEFTGLTVTKELGKLWAGLSVMLKLKYKQMEERARNDYLRKVKEWQRKYHLNECISIEEKKNGSKKIASIPDKERS